MGMAKEIPSAILMVLMPIASPSRLTNGPPELPNVIAASVYVDKVIRPSGRQCVLEPLGRQTFPRHI